MAVILKAMTRFAPWLIAATLSLTVAPAAQAVCIYRGELYARTTVQQEFADAPLVVRARLLSAVSGGPTDDLDPWTVYRLEVFSTFKGDPPREISVFTERNSGGFYMDRGGEGPDIGQEYLLFLQPRDSARPTPAAGRGAMVVNYSCGRSGRWQDVDRAARSELRLLVSRAAR